MSRSSVVYWAAAFGVLLGVAGLVFKVNLRNHSPADTVFDGMGGFLFLGAGVLAHARRPANRVGLLMVLVGAGFFAEDLQLSRTGWVHTVGLLLITASGGFAAHLVLAFPSGLLASRLERLLVGAAYAAVFVLTPVTSLFDDTRQLRPVPRPNLLLVAPDPAVVMALRQAVETTAAIVALGVMAVLVRRWLRASLPMRRILVPVFLTGLIGAACIVVYGVLGSADSLRLATRWVYWMAFCLLPLGFLGWVLRVRLRRTPVGMLLARLREPLSAEELQAAVARALGDPSLQVGWWRPDAEAFVDGDGRPLELPQADAGRAVRVLEREGRRVAVLVHDPALREDEHVLDAVTAAAGLALENRLLAADTGASRSRIVDLDMLTQRECEVLALMADGCSNGAICKLLRVEPKTVESHVRSIFLKLDLPRQPDDHRRVLAVLAYHRARR